MDNKSPVMLSTSIFENNENSSEYNSLKNIGLEKYISMMSFDEDLR